MKMCIIVRGCSMSNLKKSVQYSLLSTIKDI